jgi:hypothetical protein
VIQSIKEVLKKHEPKTKKLLLKSSTKCPKLTDMFKIKKTEIRDKIIKTGKSTKLHSLH